jgi:hypothetical protein
MPSNSASWAYASKGRPAAKRSDSFAMIAPHSLSIGSDEMLNADSGLDPGIKDERTSAELAQATKVLGNDGKLALLVRQTGPQYREPTEPTTNGCLTAGRYH